jgi:hypothetical protein
MDEAPAGRLAEQVHPQILHLWKFHIQPILHRAARQLADREPGLSLQQKLQGYVVFLHEGDLSSQDPRAFSRSPGLRSYGRATELRAGRLGAFRLHIRLPGVPRQGRF